MSCADSCGCGPERAGTTVREGLDALVAHAVAKAETARHRYGPRIGGAQLAAMLEDPEIVRFPTVIRFDGELLAGEFAHAEASGESRALQYTIWVHPRLAADSDLLARAVAYHLVRINYGDIATSDAAEAFGAALFGISRDDYYRQLCELADALTGDPARDPQVN